MMWPIAQRICVKVLFLLLVSINFGCTPEESATVEDGIFQSILSRMESIQGKTDYLASPFVTAGDRLYMVGHQDGSFPDLGWHVTGEMGGIWHHPIKLMDGFSLQLRQADKVYCLDQADQFRNYPIAGQHSYHPKDWPLVIQRTQLVPDDLPGLIIEITLTNTSAEPFSTELQFGGWVDLRPVWLGERSEMTDQPDTARFDQRRNAWLANDTGNDWQVLFGSNLPPVSYGLPAPDCLRSHGGKGIDRALAYTIALPPNATQSILFFIAGGYQTDPGPVYDRLQSNYLQLAQAKAERYQKIKEQAALDIPDPQLQQAYTWTKYASDWLAFKVGDHPTGIAAGIPDYPWWFGCDQTYSVRGLLSAGMPELAKEAMQSLIYFSEQENGNGRIVHEVSTNGVVFNPGNINETAHFIGSAWELVKWTGDTAFLQQVYPLAKSGLEWLDQQDKDQNGYPDGHGMMEIRGFDAEMVDVVSYLYEACLAFSEMAGFLGFQEEAQNYQKKAEKLKSQINTDWWVEREGSFADFRATHDKAMGLLSDALVRADTLGKHWSVKDLQTVQQWMEANPSSDIGGYAFYHNWVVNTPLETGAASPEKAQKALKTARQYVSPFGVYVTGIDRKAQESKPEAFASLKAKESFNYTGAVMTLPTGVQAIAAANYGQMDEALDYLQRMCTSFSFAAPGSMYEVSPDYGMPVQAWNIYSIARPLVSHFLGIQPEAQNRLIQLKPHLPDSWDRAAIRDLPIGNNRLNVAIVGDVYTIEQSESWTIELFVPVDRSILVDGQPHQGQSYGEWTKVELSGKKHQVELQ